MNFYKDVAPTVETKDGDKIYVNDIAVNSKMIPELVNNGCKNLLDLENCTFDSSDGLSYKISNSNEITVSTTSSSSLARSVLINNINLPVNTTLVLSGCPENGSGTSYLMDVIVDRLELAGSVDIGTGSTGFILNSDQTACIRIRIAANYTMSNKVFKVMVCTKEAWDVSHEFVPYKPDAFITAINISSESDLDTFRQGCVTTSPSVIVAGFAVGTWMVIRTYILNSAANRKMQIIETQYGDRKTRFYNGSSWGSWV